MMRPSLMYVDHIYSSFYFEGYAKDTFYIERKGKRVVYSLLFRTKKMIIRKYE